MRCPRFSELPPPPEGKTGWPWTGEGEQMPNRMGDGEFWPFISIVTPSYNQGDYLEATIRSILLQGYPNLEYIIIDGGSSDGSVEIIRKYEPWIAHWESISDGGHMAGLQKGFDRCSGEIMTWLNSDDMYFPWTLLTAGELFSALPRVRWMATAIPCQMISYKGLFNFQHVPGYSRRGFFSQNFHRNISFIQQEGCFWRKELWEVTGARLDTTLAYAGDFELWSRFWQKTDLYTIRTPLAIFRVHANQKSSSIDRYLQEARSILKKYRRPFPFPQVLLCIIAYGLKRVRSDLNWFGVGARRIYISRKTQHWATEITFRTF
jgi:glycosyltransferase involved in cell wall biosynthesis